MPRIEVSTIVKQSRDEVYKLIKKMEDFPSFMRGVKKLNVLERSADRLVTEWEIEIDGAVVTWKEEDIFNDSEKSLRFKMIEGDYSAYDGFWKIEDALGCTKISILAYFDWGMPVFEKLVGEVLFKKAHKSLRSMLNAIKKKLNEQN